MLVALDMLLPRHHVPRHHPHTHTIPHSTPPPPPFLILRINGNHFVLMTMNNDSLILGHEAVEGI